MLIPVIKEAIEKGREIIAERFVNEEEKRELDQWLADLISYGDSDYTKRHILLGDELTLVAHDVLKDSA